MNKLTYNIKLFSYWQAGSGKGSGNLSDSTVLKDNNGLPYLPGKTIKGLLLDAAKDDGMTDDNQKAIFGVANGQLDTVIFENAVLPAGTSATLLEKPQIIPSLYEIKAFVKLTADKQAVNGALRTNEVCIPLTLTSTIHCQNDEQVNAIKDCFPLVKHLGLKRNRGFGRCMLEVANAENTNA